MTELNKTHKAEAFASNPLKDSKLDDLPALGKANMAKMKAANIDSAEQLIGQCCTCPTIWPWQMFLHALMFRFSRSVVQTRRQKDVFLAHGLL
jgi:hypothetical protein